MCDLGGGEVLIASPRGGAGLEVAQIALEAMLGGDVRPTDDLDAALETPLEPQPRIEPRFDGDRFDDRRPDLDDRPADFDHFPYDDDPRPWRQRVSEVEREREPERYGDPGPDATHPPFRLERWRVPEGRELEFTSTLQDSYVSTLLASPWAIEHMATEPFSQLRTAPNWRLRTSANDDFKGPFELNPAFREAVRQLDVGRPCCGGGTTIAVLDSGFDPRRWRGADPEALDRITGERDLIAGAPASRSHGTLVAALAALAAPSATIHPLRIAGKTSTDWDAIRALYEARQLDADVAVLAFRQALTETPCGQCGLVRTGARSEVFAQAITHVTQDDRCAVVVAAGNDRAPELARPAAYADSLPVAALDAAGTDVADYSNWAATAPGRVWALPGTDVATNRDQPVSGTSFSCAVAGGLLAARISHDHQPAGVVAAQLTAGGRPAPKNTVIPH